MPYALLDPSRGPVNAGLKGAWAKHHIRALDEEMRKWREGKPYTITSQDDLEAGQHIVHLRASSPTATMGLIAGDIVSCLRASLDHLACALTRSTDGTRNDRASFPIVPVDNSPGRKQFKEAVIGIPGKAIEIIDSLQPYRSRNAYAATKLWRLHRLWNIDKHRRIPFHGTVANVQIRFPADMPPIMSRSDYESVARFPLAAKGDIYFEPTVEVDVEFGDIDEGIIVPRGELNHMYEFIRDQVAPRFESFFEK